MSARDARFLARRPVKCYALVSEARCEGLNRFSAHRLISVTFAPTQKF